MVAASIVHANADELDNYEIDDDNGIIAVEDIPQQPPHAPLIVNDTEDNCGDGDNNVDANDDEDYNDSSDEDNNDKLAAETDVQEGNESDSDQGVQRSQRRGKGTSKKYADYSLLMASR